MSFEATLLPSAQKRELCEALFAEFGLDATRITTDGEMIHSCRLPFGQHANGDAKPSASLNYEKLTFRCLGCGASGGLLWFISAMRGEDVSEAREWLGTRTGLSGSVMELQALLELLDAIAAGESHAPPVLPCYDPSVLRPWTWNIQHPYLTEIRGIPEETLRAHGVGYAEDYYDHTERIIIPHWWRGELVGWQARRLNPRDRPKYKNSPDFPRDRTLFNDAVTKNEHAVVVESPMSVLRHQHHVPTMTATFGAAVSEQQLKWIGQFPHVTLWMDNDEAGWNSTEKMASALSRLTSVSVVESPYDADPADMTDRTVDDLIAEAVPYSIWDRPMELI